MFRFLAGISALIVLLGAQPSVAATQQFPTNVQDMRFTYGTTSYPFVPSLQNQQSTYGATFARQSPLIELLPLSEPGIWNSIKFTADGLVAGHFRSFFDDTPELNNDGSILNPWRVSGRQSISGNLGLFDNNNLLGSTTLGFSFFDSCGGVSLGACGSSVGDLDAGFSGILSNFDNRDLGTYFGSDLLIVRIVFDDLKTAGKWNGDRGTFAGGEYSREWVFQDNIISTYDYTPVSQVPLPAALWMFLSALSVLGLVAARGRKK